MAETEMTEEQAQLVVSAAQELKVIDRLSYMTMANYVLLLRKAVKYFEDLYRPRIRQADDVTKALREDMRRLQEPALNAQRYGDGQLTAYDNEQARIAKEKQLKEQAERDKREKEEKAQLAELARKAGEKQLEQEIMAAPSEAPPVYVRKETPKVAGLSYREDWKFEITNWTDIPPRFHRMEQNARGEWSCKVLKDIGIEVERLKQTTNIPGVRVYSLTVPIGRG